MRKDYLVFGVWKHIKNYNLLNDIYGYWPTFHDAEIIKFYGNRNTINNEGPFFELIIHVFEMTDKTDPKGYYILTKHNLVHFNFIEIIEWQFNGFNHQNALLGIDILEEKGTNTNIEYLVFKIDSAFGMGGILKCESAEILSVKPCDKDGNT